MPIYYVYPKFVASALAGLSIKAMLLNAGAAFNAAHDFADDLVANEVTGGGYARQTVAGTVTSDSNGGYFTPSGAITFTTVTATVGFVAFISDTGNDATSRVISLIQLDTPVSLAAKSFKINFIDVLIEGAV
jgi:hypothetical protein